MTKLGTIEKTNDLYYAETINKRRVWQRATSRSLLVVYFDKISLKSVYYYAWFGGGKLKKNDSKYVMQIVASCHAGK